MQIKDFIGRYFPQAQAHGEGNFQALCPVHDDKTPSLSIKEGVRGRILVKCHACGAGAEEVCAAVGCEVRELMGLDMVEKKEPEEKRRSKKRFVRSYKYLDEDGNVLFRKNRYILEDSGKKTFTMEAFVPETGNWAFGVSANKVRRVLYRLQRVVKAAMDGGIIFFVEGEKDVETLEAHGFTATTTPDGAGNGSEKWQDDYVEAFSGARMVIIVPDNDRPPKDSASPGWQGQKFAAFKRDKLTEAGVACLVLELPDSAPDGSGKGVKDVTDWFSSGGKAEALKQMVAASMAPGAQVWVAPWERPDAPVIPVAPKKSRSKKGDGVEVQVAEYTRRVDWNDTEVPIHKRLEAYTEWVIGIVVDGKKSDAGGREDVPIDRIVSDILKGQMKDLKKGMATLVIQKAVVAWVSRKAGRLFYHLTYHDYMSSMFFMLENKKLCLIESDWFRSWLAKRVGLNREDVTFKRTLSAILDEALHGKESRGVVPEQYFARRPGAHYISAGVGRMCKITAARVSMVDNGTDGVLFDQRRTLDAWALSQTPRDPFTHCAIWRDMSTSETGKRILKIWAMSMIANYDSRPPLVCVGQSRSGKTTAVRGLFKLLGVPERNMSVEASEKGDDNFWVSVSQGGLLLLDNVDTRIKWLPDSLAAASTNGSREKKRLYTNDESITLSAHAWVAISSLSPHFASDVGLADRLLRVQFEENNRPTKGEVLFEEIEEARNDGLTWVANAIRSMLADPKPVPGGINKRHPDFAKVAVKLGRAIGEEEEITAALRHAELDKSLFNLQEDPFGQALLVRFQTRYEGSAGAILDHIKPIVGEENVRKRGWNAMKISALLRKLWPHLREIYGIEKRIYAGNTLYLLDPIVDLSAFAQNRGEVHHVSEPPTPEGEEHGVTAIPETGYTEDGSDDERDFFEGVD